MAWRVEDISGSMTMRSPWLGCVGLVEGGLDSLDCGAGDGVPASSSPRSGT